MYTSNIYTEQTQWMRVEWENKHWILVFVHPKNLLDKIKFIYSWYFINICYVADVALNI